jgi:hypothetical protein
MNKLLFAFLISTLTLSAYATDEGVFDVRITEQDNGGDASMLIKGWTCISDSSVGYQEELVNHKGVRGMHNRRVKGSFASTEFRKDMRVTSAVTSRISENCTRTVKHWQNDPEGRLVQVDVQEVMTFNWDCTFTKFPQKAGHTVSTTCQAAKSGTGALDVDRYVTAAMRQKKIHADITLKKRYESYAVDLCKGKNLKNRKVIKLTQGLDSLMFENDFVIKLEIAGVNTPVTLRNDDGVLNDEIIICQSGPIQIKVSAVEEDPIYDDIYSCAKGSSIISLNAKSWDNSATVAFKRDNFWDKLFLDKTQEIRFEIRESPVQ